MSSILTNRSGALALQEWYECGINEFMRRTLMALLGGALFALPASALERRVFTSADGSKTFEGVLTDYDAKAQTIKISKKGSGVLSFKMALLSEEDHAYIKEEGPALAAAKAIRLDLDVYKDKPITNRSRISRTVTTPAGYEIELQNWTKNDVEDVEIRYTIFHRKDAEDGPGSIGQTKGSMFISTVFANSNDMNRTDPINLVRYSRKQSGGG